MVFTYQGRGTHSTCSVYLLWHFSVLEMTRNEDFGNVQCFVKGRCVRRLERHCHAADCEKDGEDSKNLHVACFTESCQRVDS